MTISEFKAWLEGFEVSLPEPAQSPSDSAMNASQWQTIKRKLAAVTDRTGPSFNPIQITPKW